MIDYAAQCHGPLARWLDRLAYQSLDTRLRILLLEREAPEGFGWWHDLTMPALREGQARRELFHAPRPRVLPELAALEERRGLMAAALPTGRALRPTAPARPDVPAPGADPGFDARLAQPQFGNPLSLVMAGVIALDRGPGGALALRRLDAAQQLGRRELDRLEKLAASRGIEGAAMRHLVAFNGLVGGLPLAGLREAVAEELAASRRSASLDAVVPLLEQELPPRAEADVAAQDRRLGTIQPDLIGEAAIIEAFAGAAARETEAGAVVRRAYALGQRAAAGALLQLVQDFAYALEDRDAIGTEKAIGRRVMDWLLVLAREIEDPGQVLPLAEALPKETTVLRELAAELTARIADFFRREAERSGEPAMLSSAAAWVNNLAHRLGALGRRAAALAAAEEAVRLYRTLAEDRPDAFAPELAASLNNLANGLGALGRRAAALAAAEEAVRLYRPLAEARPDAFAPELARSLWVFGDLCAASNQPELALSTLREGVRCLTPAFAVLPAALENLMIGLVRSYISCCDTIGQEPDRALLAPVAAVLKQLEARRGAMSGSDRSVTARDITGSSVVTGDHSTATTRMTQHPLPPPETVDVRAELAALREALARLNPRERGKLDRAVQDAEEEAAKPEPDKEEVAGAVGRIVRYAKAAEEFSAHSEKLLPRLAALGSWLGTHGQSVLRMVGIAP